MIERRIQVIGGDVASDGLGLDESGRAVLATCDTVIPSAATVSFDSPLDLAVEVNLLGPSPIPAVPQEICPADDRTATPPPLVPGANCYLPGTPHGPATQSTS